MKRTLTTVAVLVAALIAPAAASAHPYQNIWLAMAHSPGGSKITVEGYLFNNPPPAGDITLRWGPGGQTLATATPIHADASGRFTTSITVPVDALPGRTYQVVTEAYDQSGQLLPIDSEGSANGSLLIGPSVANQAPPDFDTAAPEPSPAANTTAAPASTPTTHTSATPSATVPPPARTTKQTTSVRQVPSISAARSVAQRSTGRSERVSKRGSVARPTARGRSGVQPAPTTTIPVTASARPPSIGGQTHSPVRTASRTRAPAPAASSSRASAELGARRPASSPAVRTTLPHAAPSSHGTSTVRARYALALAALAFLAGGIAAAGAWVRSRRRPAVRPPDPLRMAVRPPDPLEAELQAMLREAGAGRQRSGAAKVQADEVEPFGKLLLDEPVLPAPTEREVAHA